MCDSLPWEGREGFYTACITNKPLPATAQSIAPLPRATVWTQVSYKSATLARWKSPSIRILILKGHLA
ncbi:hypothetical protein HDF22_002795, partial [Mucilaginibacter lappiensis]|nr:hypothetical protein [Mucilaginibacter lappiensis]